MKKLFLLLTVCLVMLALLCGCVDSKNKDEGGKTNGDGNGSDSSGDSSDGGLTYDDPIGSDIIWPDLKPIK